jgi:putative ABC transport system substrate-binding protein
MRRREFLGVLGGAAAAWPLAASAQQPGKVARIGYLGATSAFDQASWVEALRSGLRDLGYVEGKNFVIEFRWAEGRYDRLPLLAAELVGLKVDVLVTHGTPGTRAAKQATTTVPIIMAVAGDAVATGVIPSLARPGGNVTGSTFFHPDITAKRVGLLKEAIPHARKVAVLLNPNNPVIGPGLQALEGAAEFLKVELQTFEARGPDEIESAFSAMAKRSIDALTIIDG